MSSFEELQKRAESAEKQFAAMSRQRRDYGQRLIDMIAMHERNLADGGGRMAALRAEADQAQALAQQRERELGKVQGENEQLRQMLHALLTAIERGRSNEFDETMLELDQRISAMVAASGDAGPPSAEEVSQAPEIWSHPLQDDDDDDDGDEAEPESDWQGIPAAAGQTLPNPYTAADRDRHHEEPAEAPAVGEPSGSQGWSAADDDDPAFGTDGDDLADDAGAAGDGDAVQGEERPPTLEEVLELAEASAQDDFSAEEDAGGSPGESDETLSQSDMASLTSMLEQSLAAATEEDGGGRGFGGGEQDNLPAGLMQAPIAEITDRIRAEQSAGPATGDEGPADPPGGSPAAGGDVDEDGFELLDEAELERSLGQMSDRLFSAEDYDESGFGPVAAAEASGEDDDEGDEETAFDLSDLDLGGEIDGPPEAALDSEDGADPDSAAVYGLDAADGAAAAGGGAPAGEPPAAVEAEEEAELARWQAEVLGRVAAEADDAPRRGGGPGTPRVAQPVPLARQDAGGADAGAGRDRRPMTEDDDALAELDAILAEEDRTFAMDRDVAPVDPEAEWDRPPSGSPPDGKTRRGLAPALRDSLDEATRAEILARVRQSHAGRRGDQDD